MGLLARFTISACPCSERLDAGTLGDGRSDKGARLADFTPGLDWRHALHPDEVCRCHGYRSADTGLAVDVNSMAVVDFCLDKLNAHFKLLDARRCRVNCG